MISDGWSNVGDVGDVRDVGAFIRFEFQCCCWENDWGTTRSVVGGSRVSTWRCGLQYSLQNQSYRGILHVTVRCPPVGGRWSRVRHVRGQGVVLPGPGRRQEGDIARDQVDRVLKQRSHVQTGEKKPCRQDAKGRLPKADWRPAPPVDLEARRKPHEERDTRHGRCRRPRQP